MLRQIIKDIQIYNLCFLKLDLVYLTSFILTHPQNFDVELFENVLSIHISLRHRQITRNGLSS